MPAERALHTGAESHFRINWRLVLLSFVLLAITFVAYLPVRQAGFIWDDDYYVTNNSTLRDLPGLARMWFTPGSIPQYYPLVHTTFWIEYHLWKLQPLGYHLVNVFLHAANAILLWLVLRELKVPGALLAAAVFAVHPVHVESVAWITERKNVLSGFFYLATLLIYLKHQESWRWYSLATLLFICALLSKSVTATLPAVILLLIWWKRGRISPTHILQMGLWLILGLIAGLRTAHLEQVHVGAHGPEWDFSLLERLLIASRALWFYAWKLIWPHPLVFIYPRCEIDASRLYGYLFIAAAAGVFAALWLFRKKLGRGPLAAALIFAGTLVPALGFVNIYPMRFSFVADHFQYLASIALIVLLCAGVTRIVQRRTLQLSGTVLAACVVLLLATLTWQQTRIYHDQETLWTDTLSKNPQSWMSHHNYGQWLATQGRFPEAKAQYVALLGIKPDFAEGHYNLGLSYMREGKVLEALAEYNKTLALKPTYVQAMNDLAWIKATSLDPAYRDGPSAVRLAERARDLYGVPEVLDTLAAAYAETGRFPAAITTAQDARKRALEAGNAALAKSIEQRLALYRTSKPFRH